jgi:hypothetical protein
MGGRMSNEHDPKDPVDLDSVDRQIRINELEEKVKALGGGTHFVSEGCPPEMHEQFLENVLAYEEGPFTTHLAMLEKAGVTMPAPETLDDATLSKKLWEVIHALAELDTTVSRTDHLSDRELYAHLWSESLREETMEHQPGSGWMCHIDILGGCSEEDIENSLRYYESEEYRQRWVKDFPDYVLPAHVDPPYDRDRLLPGGARPELPELDEGEDAADPE